jgi:hypothetical protein
VLEEESCIGWWPLSVEPGPSFYAYTYPEPVGIRSARVGPAPAYFDTQLGEFVLPYDAVRRAPDPDTAALEFFQSTYVAGAELAGWDRSGLEPVQRPEQLPHSAGSASSDPSPNEHGRQRARPPEPDR